MPRLIDDETWAILTIWQEARGEPYEGKVAVAQVIQARMARKFNSDGTLVGTVLRPYQFSGWNTEDPNRLHAARLDDDDPELLLCRQAWRDALGGMSVVPTAVFYFNPIAVPHRPTWATDVKYLRTIGRHAFYAA